MLQRVASAPSIFNQPVGSFQFEAPSLFGAPAPAPSTGPRIPTLLQELDLSYNGISDKGAKDLADALTVNTKLRKLSLRGNVIGEVGAKALVEAFVGHSYGYNSRGIILPTLDLGENHDIGNDGALAIAGTLKTNIKLEDLGLSHCIIGDVGAKALRRSIQGEYRAAKCESQREQNYRSRGNGYGGGSERQYRAAKCESCRKQYYRGRGCGFGRGSERKCRAAVASA